MTGVNYKSVNTANVSVYATHGDHNLHPVFITVNPGQTSHLIACLIQIGAQMGT